MHSSVVFIVAVHWMAGARVSSVQLKRVGEVHCVQLDCAAEGSVERVGEYCADRLCS